MPNPLTEPCLQLAWSQWCALGVSGVVAPPDHAVDLEALILFTATLRDADPRLHAEALDWCIRFGKRTVSVARLRRLLGRLSPEHRHQFGELASYVNGSSSQKWPGAGTKTARFRPSGKSRFPAPFPPSLVQLRLRFALGTSARAEILLALLMAHDRDVHSARTLSWLGYTKQTITTTLDELCLAEITIRLRQGNQYLYRLSRHDALARLVEPLPATAPPWGLRLPVLASLRDLGDRIARQPPIVQDVETNKEMRRHVAAFRAMGIPDTRAPLLASSWKHDAAWAIDTLIG